MRKRVQFLALLLLMVMLLSVLIPSMAFAGDTKNRPSKGFSIAWLFLILTLAVAGAHGTDSLAPQPPPVLTKVEQPFEGLGPVHLNPVLSSGLGRTSMPLVGKGRLQLALGQPIGQPVRIEPGLPSRPMVLYHLTTDPENRWFMQASQSSSRDGWELAVSRQFTW